MRVLALAGRDRVRKHVAAPDMFDGAAMSAGVARQAGMGRRIDVPRPHPIAGLEARRRARLAPLRSAGQGRRHVRGVELARQRLARPQRMAGRHLVGTDQSALDQELLEPQQPLRVVGAREIDVGRQQIGRASCRERVSFLV